MNNDDIQRNPLLVCSLARGSNTGTYTLTFHDRQLARSFAQRFRWAVTRHRRAMAEAGDLDGAREIEDYIITQSKNAIVVRYLPDAPGILSTSEEEAPA